MKSFKKPTKRVAIVTGVAGAAVLGAVAVGGAAFADGPAAPSTSASAPAVAAPSGAPSAPAAPSGAPAAPGQQGSGSQQATPPTPKPHIGGEVTAVSGSTVTVKDHDGFTRTIQLSTDATVTKDGSKADTSAITTGAHIEATGSVDSNGTTLDATEVQVGQPAGPKGGHDGGPGRGGPAAGGPAANGQAPTPPSGAPAAPQQGQQQGGTQGSTTPSAPAPSASGSVQGS